MTRKKIWMNTSTDVQRRVTKTYGRETYGRVEMSKEGTLHDSKRLKMIKKILFMEGEQSIIGRLTATGNILKIP